MSKKRKDIQTRTTDYVTRHDRLRDDQLREEKMLKDPYLWPCWPYLPIKRHLKGDNGPECCLLCATEFPWQIVYAANMFHLPPTVEEFKATHKYTFASLAQFQMDGWVID